jgi:DNA invertase Pin-like site-specific DNA recombinase
LVVGPRARNGGVRRRTHCSKGEGEDGMATCILYGRVSSRRQAETFSLPTQFRELRAWAEANGYEVVEEVADSGGKDSKRDVFDRPGVERIFDICERRHVDIVLAQERSRFGEYPVPDMIAFRLAQYGTTLRTPGDTGEGEAGELMQMFTDWTSRRERRTTARRSRSRKLEQARSGFVVPTHTATYGFRVAGERTKRLYEVEERHMRVVRRIFEMVGLEGLSLRACAKMLNAEGIPTPPSPIKAKRPEKGYGWRPQFVRRCVLNDAYRPHTKEEVAQLVERGFIAPDVAALLDPERGYGIWWYKGRDFEGNEHRVAVPVPDSGVPREVADAARAAVADNVPLSAAGGGRFWELLGGILYCGGCGLRMQAHAVKMRGRVYHYLRCPFHLHATTSERCPVNARLRAEEAEEAVWQFVVRLLVEPERMIEAIDGLIAGERLRLRGDPEAEIRALHERLSDLTRRRGAFQDQQAAGMMTLNELGDRLKQLDDARGAILREIDANENRGERLQRLVGLRDRLGQRAAIWDRLQETIPDLEKIAVPWEQIPPEVRERMIGPMPWHNDAYAVARKEALENATPEERHAHYRELELRVVARSKEELEISGVFGEELIYIWNPSPRRRRAATTS